MRPRTMSRLVLVETRLVTCAVILACALSSAGCAVPAEQAAETASAAAAPEAPAPAAASAPLAGTAWRLLEIQSMDDAAGTTRVANPSLYTMRLMPDGSVAFRLNCNTATGTWFATAGPDPSSGRFMFGPLAATTVACPPPSVDEQVTRQAPYFRSYLLKDGRLYLSLLADGGIFVWEPLESGG